MVTALLLYGALSGLLIWLLPFSVFNQLNVLVHTLVGLAAIPLIVWYSWRHWQDRRRGRVNHNQILGYGALALLLVCLVSGLVATWQGALDDSVGPLWITLHLYSGVGVLVLLVLHLAAILVHRPVPSETQLAAARRRFYRAGVVGTGLLILLTGAWAVTYRDPPSSTGFVEGYDWRFGPDQPFLPSLARLSGDDLSERVAAEIARVLEPAQGALFQATMEEFERRPPGEERRVLQRLDRGARDGLDAVKARVGALGMTDVLERALAPLDLTQEQRQRIDAILERAHGEIRDSGAIEPEMLARSSECGRCHVQIYQEWLPSAHRYASMDVAFQAIQELTAQQVSPAATRYCAGCHDPISLFAGAKNPREITLSAEGYEEGISCVACHSIVQTDIRGNADYEIELQDRYAYELHDGALARFASDFLIRTYPRQHVESFSRPLYRTAEYCGACHKQFVDEMLNQDIGMVLAQNQFDSWQSSHWRAPDDVTATITCRECHMPLEESTDPSAGDIFNHDFNRTPQDGKHRNHAFPGANQVIPVLQNLEGGVEHVAYVERWLRGEVEIPEIAERWADGRAVELDIQGPDEVSPGDAFSLRVTTHNNKVGHDFPTGPLDVIESWVELTVVDDAGTVLHHSGGLDEDGMVVDPLILYHSDPFDREGERLWRHELWTLVGTRYKRSLFPAQSDVATLEVALEAIPERLSDRAPASLVSLDAPAGYGSRTLTATAVLWYRKFNPKVVGLLLGPGSGLSMPGQILPPDTDLAGFVIPATDLARASRTIHVRETKRDPPR